MSATLTLGGVNVSGVAFTATVQCGRDSIDSQPDASVMEVTVRGWQPAGALLGAAVLSDDIGVMFAGAITDLNARLEPVDDGTPGPDDWSTGVSAVGPLAALGRIVIGDEPWPQETDSARVARILDVAGMPHQVNPNVIGPNLLATDVDRRSALELAQDAAADALGVLWEQPADPFSPVRYTPQRLRAWQPVAPAWSELPADQSWDELPPAMTWADWTTAHYSGELTTPTLELHASRVIANVELGQQIGDLVRRVRVEYGPEPDDGDRPQVIAGTGPPELSMDTQLADLESAEWVADSVWRARREPAWRMTRATIRLSDLEHGEQATIRNALAVGTKLTLTDINFHAPIGVTWQGYIDGWTHELGGDTHTLTLNLVDRRLVEPSNRWQDIDPALQWQQIDPVQTWDDSTGGFHP